MIVVDTSVLTGLHPGSSGRTSTTARRVVGADVEWYAPGHQSVELLSSLRGLVPGRKISPAEAEGARKLYGLQSIAHVEVVWSVADRVRG